MDIPRTSSSSIRAELGKIYGPPYGKMNLIEKEIIKELTESISIAGGLKTLVCFLHWLSGKMR